MVSAEHLQETLELEICHPREVWNLDLVARDQLRNLWSLLVLPDALIDEDEHLNVFGYLYGVLVHEDQAPVFDNYLSEVIRRLP